MRARQTHTAQKKVGLIFREARKQQGYSQRQLADRTGLTCATIQNVEKGDTVTTDTIHVLLKSLCLTLSLSGNIAYKPKKGQAGLNSKEKKQYQLALKQKNREEEKRRAEYYKTKRKIERLETAAYKKQRQQEEQQFKQQLAHKERATRNGYNFGPNGYR